jgi:hypothetical protein
LPSGKNIALVALRAMGFSPDSENPGGSKPPPYIAALTRSAFFRYQFLISSYYSALWPKWKGVQEKLNLSILRSRGVCGRIGVSLK